MTLSAEGQEPASAEITLRVIAARLRNRSSLHQLVPLRLHRLPAPLPGLFRAALGTD